VEPLPVLQVDYAVESQPSLSFAGYRPFGDLVRKVPGETAPDVKLELPRSPFGLKLLVGCAWLGMKSSLSLASSIACDQTKFTCEETPCQLLMRKLVLQRVVNGARLGLFHIYEEGRRRTREHSGYAITAYASGQIRCRYLSLTRLVDVAEAK